MFVHGGFPQSATVCRLAGGEKRLSTRGRVATFEDPPGVKGHATPSGGTILALGLVYWAGPLKLKNAHLGTNGSVIVSCTVIAADSRICQESFSFFEKNDVFKLVQR
jgi:hypothetical protein